MWCKSLKVLNPYETLKEANMTDLKPCPFCGGEATLCSVVSMQHEICYVVKCDDLNCVMCAGGTLRQTISQAIEAWNRRVREEDKHENLD